MRAVRLSHGQGQGRRARAALPTTRPGSRRCATRSARRTDPGRRQRRVGRRHGDRRDDGRSTARPAGSSTSSSPAPSVEDLAAVRRRKSRAGRGRRVDPPGGRSLSGARPRGRRHRGAQGAAPRRRAARASGSPRTSGCRWWSRRRSRPRWGWRRGWPWRRRSRSCLRLRAGHRSRLLADDVSETRSRPSTAYLAVRLPRSPTEHLGPLRRHPGAGGPLAGPAGRGTCGGPGSVLVTAPSTELARTVVSALVEAGSARSWSLPVRATPR